MIRFVLFLAVMGCGVVRASEPVKIRSPIPFQVCQRFDFDPNRDELRKLTGPDVALADVTAVRELMLKNKHDLDLTGNGLNHPNDFGHRLYAQAILNVLRTPK